MIISFATASNYDFGDNNSLKRKKKPFFSGDLLPDVLRQTQKRRHIFREQRLEFFSHISVPVIMLGEIPY